MLIFTGLLSLPAFAATPEPQSKQAKEVKALVDRGAALVEKKGQDAFPEFRRKGSSWFNGKMYLFVDDFNGNVLVNPPDPKLEGENLMNMKDADGKLIIQAFIDARFGLGGIYVAETEVEKAG
jgi:hypothetical protein